MFGSSCIRSVGISGFRPRAIWHGEKPWTRRREFFAITTARTQVMYSASSFGCRGAQRDQPVREPPQPRR
eukprot:2722328-Pyramimonas_sp.AAC.1